MDTPAPARVIADLVDAVCPPWRRQLTHTIAEVVYTRTRNRAAADFVDDYLHLIATGETHRDRLARRLGMVTPEAMETRLVRYRITAGHTTGRPSRRVRKQPRDETR